MGDPLAGRILDCLAEKPMSISEIARELDTKKYEVSKKIEVLESQDRIKTYRIGRSTACLLREDAPTTGQGNEDDNDQGDATTASADELEEMDVERPAFLDDDDSAPDVPPAFLQEETAEDTVAETVNPVEEPVADAVEEQEDRSAATTAEAGDRPRTIGVVSGKGGVGKTVITLNLATALMEMGEKVIVMDADVEMSNLGLQLGMYTYPVSLRQVLDKDVPIMSAMHIHTESGLRVIPASLSAGVVDRDQDITSIFDQIPPDYTVIVDSAPGFQQPLDTVIKACDELIFVTTPEVPSVTDTYKLYKAALQRGKNVLGVVVNRYHSPKMHLSVTEVEKSLEMESLGVIKEDSLIDKSIFNNQPAVSLKPYAKTSRTFKQIAADISGNTYEETLMDKVKGFFA